MRTVTGLILAIVLFAASSATAPAAESHAANESAAAAHDTHAAPAANQPVLPPEGIRWPAVMLIIVIGMFLAAMVVGPVVRMTLPPEDPPLVHAHHDDAHDHGHGHGHARPRTPLDGHGGGGHH